MMHFGATMWFTDYSISPSELGVALEERAFESLWASEHSHLPIPGNAGELRNVQADVMDPSLTLTAAAMCTKTLRLGTGIRLVNQRDPIQTAKLVASIDQLSGGRFLFGIGNGWHEEEMRNHGTALATRHQVVQERVEAMRAIWTQDRAEYHGKFVDFGPMIANPKPVQKPYPPVIVGGSYPYAARRAVHYGDGWYALTGEKYGDEFAFIPKFQDMLANAGRDRASCPITICLYPEELDAFAPDQVGALARYEELGVTRCVVGFNPDKREAILPVLDRWAGLMSELGTRPIQPVEGRLPQHRAFCCLPSTEAGTELPRMPYPRPCAMRSDDLEGHWQVNLCQCERAVDGAITKDHAALWPQVSSRQILNAFVKAPR